MKQKFHNRVFSAGLALRATSARASSPRHSSGQAGQARSANSGQALIMTVLLLGGIMIATTAISGIILVYAVRQSGEVSNSVKAIYAADSGIEWELYQYFMDDQYDAPTFSNGASVETCSFVQEDSGGVANNNGVRSGPCPTNPEFSIRSVGMAGNVAREVRRAFELKFRP